MPRVALCLAFLVLVPRQAEAQAAAARPAAKAAARTARLGPCYASFDGRELVVGNARIERRWRIETSGLLTATSLRDRQNDIEWLAGPADGPSLVPDTPLPDEQRPVSFEARFGKQGATQEPSLRVRLVARGKTSTLEHSFQIFADAAAVLVQTTASGPAAAPEARASADGRPDVPTGVENARTRHDDPTAAERGVIERLQLAPVHTRLVQVTFQDQTDIHNELVFEREWLLHPSERPLSLQGNLFVIEDPHRRAGIVLVKHAPLPHARPVQTAVDLGVSSLVLVQGGVIRTPERLGRGARVALLGHGAGGPGPGDAASIVLYSGGAAARTAALHELQRQLRTYVPQRDGLFLSNTWGDRNRGDRINEEFIGREVEAAARLGVDVVQIDDGWQRGKTKNTSPQDGVWDAFWATDPNYWEVNQTRFPSGMASLVRKAAAKGMRFGLWFAPDSSKGQVNWERDAAAILKLHRTLGIDYFKVDGVALPSRGSQLNLRRFFDRVLDASGGKVVFDLDVTAGRRPGYFGMVEVGPLFVENRYTDWYRYWPHQTLRNLWRLAHYVDPVRLRMELLNNARNAELYKDDPLAPARHQPSYLFATTMFSNPLGWFEVSELPAAYFDEMAPLVRKWKEHRREIFGGRMIPIGDAPDGVAWTGFASVAKTGASAQVLVFRETNPSAEWSVTLPFLGDGKLKVEPLGGAGEARMEGKRLVVRVPETRQFLWVRVSR